MKIKTTTKYKFNGVAPRLSDEDIDPLEQDDNANEGLHLLQEGWVPWTFEDIADIKRLVEEKIPAKQQFIIEAFLDGLNYVDVGVTEKYWRYHFAKGIEFIKKELKL